MPSPELETLDQLLGGDLALPVVRRVYPDDERFLRGVHGLLLSGDVDLLTADGQPVPPWKVEELFERRAILQAMDGFKLHLTDQGGKRVS